MRSDIKLGSFKGWERVPKPCLSEGNGYNTRFKKLNYGCLIKNEASKYSEQPLWSTFETIDYFQTRDKQR